MADSIREIIIQEVMAGLSGLTTANGFNTNAGANSKRGKRQWEDGDEPCMSVFPGVESASRSQYGSDQMTMPVKIDILDGYSGEDSTLEDSEKASVKGEKMLADIREIMHKVIKKLRGSKVDDVVYRGGGIETYPELKTKTIGVTATFDITYNTLIGNPYKQ